MNRKCYDPLPVTEPQEPTDAPPGSEEKIRVLAERAAAGQSLHHPEDSLAIVESIISTGRHHGKRKPSR